MPDATPGELWHREVNFRDDAVVSIDRTHLLVNSPFDDSLRLHVGDARALPPSMFDLIDPRRKLTVLVDVARGLDGIDRLSGAELVVHGDLTVDGSPLYGVSESFDAINLGGLWGREVGRLDAARIGAPRRLVVPGAIGFRGGLNSRTVALTIEATSARDGRELPASEHLRHLELRTARRLEAWHDVSVTFPGLVELEIYAASHLRGDALTGLPSGMLSLGFTSCRRLGGMPFAAGLGDLRRVAVTDCAGIGSIGVLRHSPRLRWFIAIGDTKIEDGDLNVLVDRPIRPMVSVRKRREYHPPVVELERMVPPWSGFSPFKGRDDLDAYWPDRRHDG